MNSYTTLGRFFSPLIIISTFSSFGLLAQNKVIQTYYDLEKKQKKEEYRVVDYDTTILDGIYKTFYQNGKIKTIGFYTQGQATDFWEYFYQNGNVKMEGLINNFFQEGHWIYYYENGNKSMEGNMDKGKKNGYWRFYNEDGKIKSEGHIKEGKNDGIWKYFYEEGIVKATGNYANGVGNYTEYYPDGVKKMEGRIKYGKSDSTWNYYHPNGKLKATGTEINGLKEGTWKFFHENGLLASEGDYTKGQTTGRWKYYHEDGNLSSEGSENNGQKEGQWKMFYNNGKLKGDGLFIEGNGPYTEYYENGSKKVKGVFKKGIYDGLWEYFYEDGTLEGSCNYSNGEGWYTGYYPDGSKKMEGLLKDGNKSGVWKLYKKDGALAGYYKTYYEDNDLKGENKIIKTETSPISIPNKNNTEKASTTKSTSNKKSFLSKIVLYRPKPNIYKTLIPSVDLLQILLGAVPFYLEYYVQDRFGLELNFTYFKSPFFANVDALPLQQVYQTGQAYAVRYKKYFANEDFIGHPYIGGEFRYRDLNSSANISDSTLGYATRQSISVTEKSWESVLIVGDRFLRHKDKGGITLDIFLGVGLGIRNNMKNYIPSEEKDAIFNDYINNRVYVPFRFGISLGYAF